MDLDKLAQLARIAHWGDPDPSPWHDLSERDQASWRAVADAVRMAVEPTLLEALPALPVPADWNSGAALRERIIMQLVAHKRVDESDKVIIDRAKAFEAYILGDAVG